MWTVEPEQIWKKPRRAGISGFMRLKNESEFLNEAIATHLGALDELVIVHNQCTDETPEIAMQWARRYPDKISVFEYQPAVYPIGSNESIKLDPKSPNSIANYYNYSLSKTNCEIVIKVDGDHIAVKPRFSKTSDYVRRYLPRSAHYPIYGLNLVRDVQGRIAIYNFYDFAPEFVLGDAGVKRGPPPFTSGDHCFFYVDESSWHTIDPIEGFERMELATKPRYARAPFRYSFFHMKGMKADRGTANWIGTNQSNDNVRARWIRNVLAQTDKHLSSIEAMRRHNPVYFRGVDYLAELESTFPGQTVRPALEARLPNMAFRERLADIWYRMAYP